MIQIWKKLGSGLLTLCLVLTLLPIASFAAGTATDVASAINAYKDYTGGTVFSATVDGNTVTVTEEVRNASSVLSLEIPSGVI